VDVVRVYKEMETERRHKIGKSFQLRSTFLDTYNPDRLFGYLSGKPASGNCKFTSWQSKRPWMKTGLEDR